jgi:hypothetical protein
MAFLSQPNVGGKPVIDLDGGRSSEFVDNEKQPPKDGSLEGIFGRKAQEDADSKDHRTRSPDYSRARETQTP